MNISNIGFVLPVYNNAAVVKRCLDTLLATIPQELHQYVVISDDGSNEETQTLIHSYTDHNVVALFGESNQGYTANTNRGIEKALSLGCEYIYLLNSDLAFQPGWLQFSARYHTSNTLLSFFYSKEFTPGRLLNRHKKLAHKLEFSCVGIPARAFNELGLLASELPKGYYTDDDFCLRAMMAGFDLVALENRNNRYVSHECGVTFGKDKRNAVMRECSVIMEKKWRSILATTTSQEEKRIIQRYFSENFWVPDN